MEKIRTEIGSPIDYKELVVFLRYDGEEIALVQKEEGIDKMKIEFYGVKDGTTIYLDTLIEGLLKAKEELSIPSIYSDED
jgi:hypothetical protein